MFSNQFFGPSHLRLPFSKLSAAIVSLLLILSRWLWAHHFLFAEVLGHLLAPILLVIDVVLTSLLLVLFLLHLFSFLRLVVLARKHLGKKPLTVDWLVNRGLTKFSKRNFL